MRNCTRRYAPPASTPLRMLAGACGARWSGPVSLCVSPRPVRARMPLHWRRQGWTVQIPRRSVHGAKDTRGQDTGTRESQARALNFATSTRERGRASWSPDREKGKVMNCRCSMPSVPRARVTSPGNCLTPPCTCERRPAFFHTHRAHVRAYVIGSARNPMNGARQATTPACRTTFECATGEKPQSQYRRGFPAISKGKPGLFRLMFSYSEGFVCAAA